MQEPAVRVEDRKRLPTPLRVWWLDETERSAHQQLLRLMSNLFVYALRREHASQGTTVKGVHTHLAIASMPLTLPNAASRCSLKKATTQRTRI